MKLKFLPLKTLVFLLVISTLTFHIESKSVKDHGKNMEKTMKENSDFAYFIGNVLATIAIVKYYTASNELVEYEKYYIR